MADPNGAGSRRFGRKKFGREALSGLGNSPLPDRKIGDSTRICVAPNSGPRNLSLFVGLDHISGFQILEIRQADTAFEARGNFAGIVLEAPQ